MSMQSFVNLVWMTATPHAHHSTLELYFQYMTVCRQMRRGPRCKLYPTRNLSVHLFGLQSYRNLTFASWQHTSHTSMQTPDKLTGRLLNRYYLKGTANLQLTIGLHLNNPSKLIAYVGLDWGHDTDTRHSVSGYIFLLGKLAVSWSMKQQPMVAASSTEAEYMSVLHTTCQGLWLRHLLIELGLTHLKLEPTIIHLNNHGAMELAKESCHHNWTKHIDIQHHFVCKQVEDGTYKIIHCLMGQMLVDILTKLLHFLTFSIHCDTLRLVTS